MRMLFKYAFYIHMDQFNASSTIQQQLSSRIEAQGIEHYGFASLASPLSLEFYRNWIIDGYHGSMDYLSRHLPYKENPELLLKKARSAIVVGQPYIPHPEPIPMKVFSLRIARYARGRDYHFWLKKRMESLVLDFKKMFPQESFLVSTDSSPVLERDLAYRAGLGWVGKNSCLIDQKRGSYFLICEILTTLELNPIRPYHPDRCGRCTKCMDACPTKAILSPRQIDARKCISYLNIESKSVPSENLRSLIGDHFFGCDICQEVCPWNSKVFGESTDDDSQKAFPLRDDEKRQRIIEEIRFILKSSNKELERCFADTPLARARGFGLKRNAIIVASNLNLFELMNEISFFASDHRLGELAIWSVNRLNSDKIKAY